VDADQPRLAGAMAALHQLVQPQHHPSLTWARAPG
jgi:hypothetical protein